MMDLVQRRGGVGPDGWDGVGGTLEGRSEWDLEGDQIAEEEPKGRLKE